MKSKLILFVMMCIMGLQNGALIASETGWRSWVPERVKRFMGMSAAGGAATMATATGMMLREGIDIDSLKHLGLLSAGAGILIGIFDQLLYTSGTTSVDEGAKVLLALLNDNLAYPTYSMKIHALMKKSDFFSPNRKVYVRGGRTVPSEIYGEQFKRASVLLTEQRAKQGKEKIEAMKEKEAPINSTIAQLNEQLAPLSSLNDRVKKLEEIMTPEQKAAVSIALRLKNQQLLEADYPGWGSKNIEKSASFYKPESSSRKTGFAERKELWEENIEKAKEATAEWEKTKGKEKENK